MRMTNNYLDLVFIGKPQWCNRGKGPTTPMNRIILTPMPIKKLFQVINVTYWGF